MSEHKELAKSFVVAMVQRGYFDRESDNTLRAQKIIEAYKNFIKLLESPKPDSKAMKNLRDSM